MFPFYVSWREKIPTGAEQKTGSSNREFPLLRFPEPERSHSATGGSPHSEYKDRVQLMDPAYRQTTLYPTIQRHHNLVTNSNKFQTMKKLFFTAIVLLLSVNSFSVQAQNCDAPAAPNVNWSGCNKKYAALGLANLSGANLSGANLTNAFLVRVVSGGITGTPTALPAGWALVNGYLVGDGANLKNAILSNANLSGAILTYAALSYANLSGSNLSSANLSGANLTGADLTGVVSGGITGTPSALPDGWALVNGYLVGPGANLTGANLTGASLSDASLNGATMDFSNLSDANLSNANLTDATLFGANLTDANLTDAFLTDAFLFGANLTNANLTNANLKRAALDGANLTNATLTGVVSGDIFGTPSALPAGWALVNGYGYLVGPGANLTGADLSGANLTNANLKRAALDGANLTTANLTNANLTNANLTGANLSDANLSNAFLSDANLSNAILYDANLSNANMSNVNLSGASLLTTQLTGVVSGGITGNLSAKSPAWALVNGYLVGPGANLSGANLSNFNLSGAILRNAILTGANLSGATLTNANLNGANLTGATLTGVVSGGITGTPSALPDGWQLINGYLVGPATCGDGRYAEQVISFNQKKAINETAVVSGRSDKTKALCAPQNNNTENFVALGFGGDITLKFGKAIRNGTGNDIRVYESTFGNLNCIAYPEKARVFASQDGCRFVYLGEICQDGTVDLGALNWAQYVRIVDVSSKTAVYQSSGTPDGYDVDGVEALNGFETNPVLDPIVGGASEVVFYSPRKCRGGANISADRTDKNKALGVHQGTDRVNFVSLGFGGSITLRFKYAVENNANGLDLQVVETSYGNPTCNAYPEKARFEGSIDGSTWTDLGQLCLDGKLEMGALPYLHLLRITDESDKLKFSSSADGFDVDGVVAINQCNTATNAREAVEIVDDINTADEVEIGGIMELYPNPASESATFTFSSQTESSYEVNIVNALGQVVFSSEGKATEGANNIDLNLETLKPGLHIVQLVQDGSRQQVNLMKR